MAKTRQIQTKFWTDNWVQKLEPLQRYLFLYLLTNSRANLCGIYELPLGVILAETKLKMSENELEGFFASYIGKIHYCYGWVIIINHIKNQNQGSPKVQEGIKRELIELPEDIIRGAKILGYPMERYGYPMDTLSHSTLPYLTIPNGISSKDTYGEKECLAFLVHYEDKFHQYVSKTKNPANSKRTVLPMIEEALKEFGRERLDELLEIYMQSSNKFYEENLWSLTCFLSFKILNKLHVGNK